jgi:hypothetical protein
MRRARAHPTDLLKNVSNAIGVSIKPSERPGRDWTGRPGVRTADINGPGVFPAGAVRSAQQWKERLPAVSRYMGSESLLAPPTPFTSSGGPTRLPRLTLGPRYGYAVARPSGCLARQV